MMRIQEWDTDYGKFYDEIDREHIYKYPYSGLFSNPVVIKKTGEVNLRLTYGSDISLITCISGTNKQVVYIANLIEKEKY